MISGCSFVLLNVRIGHSNSKNDQVNSENSLHNQWLPSEGCGGALQPSCMWGASMGGAGQTPGRDPKRRCPQLYLAHKLTGLSSGTWVEKTIIFPSLILLDTHLLHRWLGKLVSRRKGAGELCGPEDTHGNLSDACWGTEDSMGWSSNSNSHYRGGADELLISVSPGFLTCRVQVITS